MTNAIIEFSARNKALVFVMTAIAGITCMQFPSNSGSQLKAGAAGMARSDTAPSSAAEAPKPSAVPSGHKHD
ncbi:MAG: hypothetical protein JNL98_15000 [Bryobacterales bacterium]|nr:hypothetical protein [Bryobacterales bacterium]